MGKTQRRTVSPPQPADKNLGDFAAVVQENMRDLFDSAHDHTVRSTPPSAAEGRPGDVVPVDDGASKKLYVKFSGGWFSATLS